MKATIWPLLVTFMKLPARAPLAFVAEVAELAEDVPLEAPAPAAPLASNVPVHWFCVSVC